MSRLESVKDVDDALYERFVAEQGEHGSKRTDSTALRSTTHQQQQPFKMVLFQKRQTFSKAAAPFKIVLFKYSYITVLNTTANNVLRSFLIEVYGIKFQWMLTPEPQTTQAMKPPNHEGLVSTYCARLGY